MMAEIICAGFGGQGVLVAGMIITYAGMDEGKNVTWFPSYGAEMRGGTANCTVKINKDEIASPYSKKLDILIALNEVSINKFENQLKPGGTLVVNSSLVSENRDYRDDINVVKVDATNIANELDNPRGMNIVALGAMAKSTGLFDTEYLKKSIDKFFADKGKVNPKNALCFDRGVSCV
ncbi:2-oxoacid:acceptor oxidoreductase family protein [Terrisporobacter mayombei]|nr:2-oxoacid:acceptor oxidoreductase family protein [Terrisporobacter othiniensis]MCC3670829.1 2-oxoacid:acceptor oxidoreductase family protein [Terrisporobacter mayombei]MCR1823251.1 2-oxoacid:acceptor oxidoreductase family protein [Terrisporobacter muris]MDU6986006.1 2-oxoacid:acceptor oxidoreductase family protein [Terrisporobacter othiniensis]MDY3373584.1 2-oxoacid:acceptor oxidoreductase family protein [Terrisporobacter othiniensis]